MAIAMGGGDDDDEAGELHEINVTPFIDVMLVLLIIFMVAAPLATVDIKVDLPASSAAPQPRPDKPVFLTLDNENALSIGNQRVPDGGLPQALDEATGADKTARIFLRADRRIDYGAVMVVIDQLRASGYLRVGLVGAETQ